MRQDGMVDVRYRCCIRYAYAERLMREYRLGNEQYKTNLEKLCQRHSLDLPGNYFEEVITADIVAGELVFHVRYTLQIVNDREYCYIRGQLGSPCPHLNSSSRGDDIFVQTLRCGMSHVDGLACVQCRRKKCCSQCLTSFRVNVRTLGPLSTQTEIKVDIWRNLGSCKSAFDPKWRSQTKRHASRVNGRQRSGTSRMPSQRVSVMIEALNEQLMTPGVHIRRAEISQLD